MTTSLVPLIDSLFNDALTSFDSRRWAREYQPALDVREADDAYIVRMDVPGVKPGDLTVELRDDILSIRGHRGYESVEEDARGGLTHVERSYGTFQRSIRLPRGAGEIDAEMKDGVLTLHIEKPIEAQPKRIEIRNEEKLALGE